MPAATTGTTWLIVQRCPKQPWIGSSSKSSREEVEERASIEVQFSHRGPDICPGLIFAQY